MPSLQATAGPFGGPLIPSFRFEVALELGSGISRVTLDCSSPESACACFPAEQPWLGTTLTGCLRPDYLRSQAHKLRLFPAQNTQNGAEWHAYNRAASRAIANPIPILAAACPPHVPPVPPHGEEMGTRGPGHLGLPG